MWRKHVSPILPTLVLCALSSTLSDAVNARPRGPRGSVTLAAGSTATGSSSPRQRRFVMLRHQSTPGGARVTLTSDQLLEDYNSYVAGERCYLLVPQASLIGLNTAPSGRGFADMRVEQRGDDVLISFILQQGATVHFSQKFNRLDLTFMTNERVNKQEVASATRR